MKKIRTGVIGVGYLGRFHAQKHKASSKTELVAVVDRNPDRAREIGAEVGVEGLGDYRSLVGRIDAATIVADTSVHYEIAKFFLQNGIHVFVEKPITVRIGEAEEICALAEKKGLILQVGHVERFNPAFTAVRDELKDPLFIRAERLAPFKTRAIDVDVVLDLMIHDLDLVLSLTKSRVKAIAAVGGRALTNATDMADVRLEFENGLVAHISASRVSQAPLRKFRVYQNDGYRSMDLGQASVSRVLKSKDSAGKPSLVPETLVVEKADALQLETEDFAGAILEGRPPRVTGRHGLETLALAEKICDEIQRSSLAR